jgi:hypothetical protein
MSERAELDIERLAALVLEEVRKDPKRLATELVRQNIGKAGTLNIALNGAIRKVTEGWGPFDRAAERAMERMEVGGEGDEDNGDE